MGEIETVEAEKMGWLDLPRGTSYPTFPYLTDYQNIAFLGDKRRQFGNGRVVHVNMYAHSGLR